MRAFGFILLFMFVTGEAQGEIIRSPVIWSVSPPFEKNADARKALSGAACVTGTSRCFAVNDEKKYAQFFSITDHKIVPEELMRLLPDEVGGVEMDEIDAEGVTYVSAAKQGGISYLYLTGSHGLSRQGAMQPSRFLVFRFPVDPSTGLPTFQFGDMDPGAEIMRTRHLRQTISSTEVIAPFAEQRLDRNGVTIEGIAIKTNEALFGLRSPCIDKNAFVLRVPLGELFGDTPPSAKATKIELGDNVGIRDLAGVEGGVLILAGRSDDDRGDNMFPCGEYRASPKVWPSLWFWSGRDQDPPKPLGMLPGTQAGDSAETLIVLEESHDGYRTLVMFDGVENGGPVEFSVTK
ncbi:DUF3616 domain-containing protein [Rhizobium leguminosarum]|uniref:DUF3616 domain-containing protein n=1 Tax=Rhizobium leguminosarum TaxID=384 RepID=UPI001C97D31C|nr:DUF3616 domain-containing protein [Rhizobium leguminosarum]MBY5735467.1 DUF3616 domain-containing protein [Rhizobium leguminosarum]